MSGTVKQPDFRRIVVTLDASESSWLALETSVRLAAILGAELEGVFVEDINLIRLAKLPFLREVKLWSLAEEAMSSQRMQRELRAMARHAEHMLAQAASETGVNWSFRVWRGSLEATSLTTTFQADVLSLGRNHSLFSRRTRLIPTSRIRPAHYRINSINVLFSESEQASRALTAACQLAIDLGASLTVFLSDSKTDELQALKNKARTILDSFTQHAYFIVLPDTDAQSLAQAVNASKNTVLIAEAGHPILQNKGLEQCLQVLSCPLLLVR